MWQEFFYFSKAEKRGAVILILIAMILLATPYLWPDASQDAATDFSAFQRAVAAWQQETNSPATPAAATEETVMAALFDPNAPEREVLAALDLSERAIRAWMSYTAKGGRFRQPADLDEFRALTPAERSRVKPYLRFPETAVSPTEAGIPEEEVEGQEIVPLQPFDPNHITREELIAFGVPAKAASSWTRFLEAGGYFRSAEDIGKLYSLPAEWRDRLLPYAQVSEPVASSANSGDESRPYPRSYPTVVIDINQATAEEWQQLYGVGPVLSGRIVKFRDLLGGFHSVDQVAETYGLPDSTFQRIRSQLQPSAILQPIYINQATERELAAHPYIHRLTAQLIANYRREHGPFQSIDDLAKLYGLEEGFVEQIKPYLVFE